MQSKINKIIFGIIILLLIIFGWVYFYDKKYKLKEYSKELFYMDTYIYVKIYEKDEQKAKSILKDINEIYEKYHKLTNRYEEYEGINNIYYIYYNNQDSETLTLDSDLYDMIKFGKEWYQKSNGLVDISKGNINDIWKMYLDSKTGFPSKVELERADINNIDDIVLLDNNQIKNNHPNIYLEDYKLGYVTNIVKEYLKENKIDKYLINADETIIVGDYYKEKGNYNIGLEDPDNKGDIYKFIKGNNISISTKGYYQNYYEYEGTRYNHIINPNTLYPGDKVKSVSVICSDSRVASILSTTLFLADIDVGKVLVKNNNCSAIWYTYDDKIIEFN